MSLSRSDLGPARASRSDDAALGPGRSVAPVVVDGGRSGVHGCGQCAGALAFVSAAAGGFSCAPSGGQTTHQKAAPRSDRIEGPFCRSRGQRDSRADVVHFESRATGASPPGTIRCADSPRRGLGGDSFLSPLGVPRCPSQHSGLAGARLLQQVLAGGMASAWRFLRIWCRVTAG